MYNIEIQIFITLIFISILHYRAVIIPILMESMLIHLDVQTSDRSGFTVLVTAFLNS